GRGAAAAGGVSCGARLLLAERNTGAARGGVAGRADAERSPAMLSMSVLAAAEALFQGSRRAVAESAEVRGIHVSTSFREGAGRRVRTDDLLITNHSLKSERAARK